jgi:hypothetical protein
MRKNPTEAQCQLLAREIDMNSIFRLDYSVKRGYVSTMTLKRLQEEWLQQLAKAFGKSVNEWKGHYYWHLSNKMLYKALERALPFMKEKRGHAELMIEFGKSCVGSVGGVYLDPKQHEYRRELIARMKKLNGEPAWCPN